MRAIRVMIWIVLIGWAAILNIYHFGVYPRPSVDLTQTAAVSWVSKDKAGINQLVLIGPDFARGQKAGEATAHLLLEQEDVLVEKLGHIVPIKWVIQPAILGAILWFHDVPSILPDRWTKEMYGVSLSAPKKYDYMADGFTRQVAYHGLHEVGQMMVDSGMADMGCTVVAIPVNDQFVLARNFDFEGGRIFDREKIMKWVFPEDRIPYLSVTWAGMVGAVTGVNAKGVYVSINAAGSDSWKRVGIPSTLVALDALEHAENSEQAVEIIRKSQMFITEIFIVLDRSGHLYRIEKSPDQTEVLRIEDKAVITNHLIASAFAQDKTNLYRQRELTTLTRQQRGEARLKELPQAKDAEAGVKQALSLIRDKGVDRQGRALTLGNRRAIDALIATHSVIYDPINGIFYVNKGPGASGALLGYDLKASFENRTPIVATRLPADPFVSPEFFDALHDADSQIESARKFLRKGDCSLAAEKLEAVAPQVRETVAYHHAKGDTYKCSKKMDQAKQEWARAQALEPAYAEERRSIERKLKL